MESRYVLAILVLAACFAAAGCGGEAGGQDGPEEGRLRVVATNSILGDMVREVGGDRVELTTLVGPDGDAHTFQPAPADNAELAEAGVIFENGLGFEPWLDDLYASSGSEAERVVATENVEPLTLEGEHAHEGEGTDGEHGDHEDGEYDPHVWFDVGNAMAMVEEIRDALVEQDPKNRKVYERNARGYLAELERLDAEVGENVEAIPEENRKLVTTHDTFGYLAHAYGFEVVGTGLASFSTEASDPSAGETAALVEEIRASGVPAIFAENISNTDLMQQVADEAGVELAPPLYTDALGEPGTEGDTYAGMMRYDVRTISEALGG